MIPPVESPPGRAGKRFLAQRDALGYSAPRNYEELRAVLSSGSMHLPRRLQQVAIYFWQHPAEVALGSITSIAEGAGVQPSTLVRFAQTFGYSGFSDFQELFKAHIKSPGTEFSGRPGLADGEGGPGDHNLQIVRGLVEAARRSLQRLDQGFDSANFAAMAGVLARAKMIYLIGSKRAFPVTTYVSLALSQQGIRNMLIDNIGSLAHDQIGCARRDDAVLAVNFSPYNSITSELAALAKQRGATILAISDSAFSPLFKLADSSLEVVEESYSGFRSLSATIALALGLVLSVVALRNVAPSEVNAGHKEF